MEQVVKDTLNLGLLGTNWTTHFFASKSIRGA